MFHSGAEKTEIISHYYYVIRYTKFDNYRQPGSSSGEGMKFTFAPNISRKIALITIFHRF